MSKWINNRYYLNLHKSQVSKWYYWVISLIIWFTKLCRFVWQIFRKISWLKIFTNFWNLYPLIRVLYHYIYTCKLILLFCAGADPAILKGGSNYMSPFKCIDWPKKGGFHPPPPPPLGSANTVIFNFLRLNFTIPSWLYLI